jgi:Tfp pilus assembly protein PilV
MEGTVRDQFVAEALEIAANVWDQTAITYSATDFALVLQNPDGQEHRIYLSNAFAQTRESRCAPLPCRTCGRSSSSTPPTRWPTWCPTCSAYGASPRTR